MPPRAPSVAASRSPRAVVVVAVVAVVAVVGAAGACGLGAGERFGRAGARPDRLRVHIAEDARELDPARATTPVERALARQLFAALVEAREPGGAIAPSLATSWERDGDRLLLHLQPGARFSDHARLDAHAVVWSWRRALRPSTGAADKAPLAVIDGGAALARGALLRVASAGARGKPPPYSIFTEEAAAPVNTGELAAGTAVRVIDTNEREPCCGVAVPLHVHADLDSPSVGALTAGDIAVVAGAREIPATRGRKAYTLLQLRAAGGASGWARADDVAVHIPAVDLVHVVDRGANKQQRRASMPAAAGAGEARAEDDGEPPAANDKDGDGDDDDDDSGPALREGPDDDAPVRAYLADDELVELVERGPDHCLVIDVKSGRSGWLPTQNIDDTVRERRFFLVEPVAAAGAGVPVWLSEQDLAFDPGLLAARAIDDVTLAVDLAPGVGDDAALAAFTEPLLRPVPPRLVEERGRAWADVDTIQTSGPYKLAAHGAEHIELARSTTSFERDKAGVARVDLIVVTRATTALHLYRAGELDVLLDGALPADLAPTLARASDFVPGPAGGALVAPEVRGLVPTSLELRGVTVVAP